MRSSEIPPNQGVCEVGPAVEYLGGVVELRMCAIRQAPRLGISGYLASQPQTLQILEYLALFVFAPSVFSANMVGKMFIALLLEVSLHFIQ
jgi:hypothetical protein